MDRPQTDRHDVFLCYASADRPAVERIAGKLHAAGLDVFFDQWNLIPGSRSMEGLEKALLRSRACAVFVGRQPGQWQATEMRTAIEMHIGDPTFRVIPVLLDGASDDAVKDFSPFLHAMTWVDFRAALDDEETLRRLIAGIRGEEPGGTSLEESLLIEHLIAEGRRYAAARLPLPEKHGAPSHLPVEAVRIDLPLQVTYVHATPASSGEHRDAEAVHWMLRLRYARTPFADSVVGSVSSARKTWRPQRIGEFLSGKPRLVLIGDPGCGKTTLLNHIAFSYADQRLREKAQDRFPFTRKFSAPGASLPERPWTPITVFCRNLAGWNPQEGLRGLLHTQFLQLGEDRQKSTVWCDLLLGRLHGGNALLLLDGLDEMQPVPRKRLAQLMANCEELPVVITTRPVGFHGIAEVLSASFDHLNVLPLGQPEKEQFARAWAAAWSEDAAEAARIRDTLLPYVSRDRNTSRLCDNVLFISLFAQMFVMDDLPRHLLDAYRRTVEIMVDRQRDTGSPPLSVNEIWPCLEHLAYRMRSINAQSLRDDEAAALIEEFYSGRMRGGEYRQREARQLVDDLLQKLAIVNDAGPALDDEGFEHRTIQFFHPSFQEYFAWQAVRHGHARAAAGNVIDSLRAMVKEFSIEERPVQAVHGGSEREPVAVGQWQEVVRLGILDLATQPDAHGATADDAFLLLLSLVNANLDEGRALTVFALQCLADGPEVTPATRHAVFDAAMDFLGALDGYSSVANTQMDVALRAVMRSRFGSECRRRFLAEYVRERDARRHRIGSALATNLDVELGPQELSDRLRSLLHSLDATDIVDRAGAALEILDLCFAARTAPTATKMSELPAELVRASAAKLVAILDTDAERDGSMSHAASWALAWLLDAYEPRSDARPELTPRERAVVLRIASDADYDAATRARCLAVYAADSAEGRFADTPSDWLERLALVADGIKPPASVPVRLLPLRELDPGPFLPLLSVPSNQSARRTALSLCRLGCLVPELTAVLLRTFEDEGLDVDVRDEALFHLTLIGNDAVVDAVLAGAVAKRRENETYGFAEHCVLGLIGLGRREVLERFLTLEGRSAEATTACGYVLDRPELRTVPWSLVGPFRTALTHAGSMPIQLVRCKDSEKRDCFFYVRCSTRRADELRAAFIAGPVNLTDYGLILASGFGRDPSPEVRRMLLEKYGFDVEGM